LTPSQKIALAERIRDWDIDMALAGRRLIRYFLSGKMALSKLLAEYNAKCLNGDLEGRSTERKNRKLFIRMTRDEKRKLILLAEEGFYLPGEVARILVELFIKEVIRKEDLWE
jgi:hypothetical protein